MPQSHPHAVTACDSLGSAAWIKKPEATEGDSFHNNSDNNDHDKNNILVVIVTMNTMLITILIMKIIMGMDMLIKRKEQ